MKQFNASASIEVHPYCSNAAPRTVEVKGRQVGELIVHHSVYWFRGEEPKESDQHWTVTHARSGLAVNSAVPQEIRNTRRRRDLLEWAERWQSVPVVKELLSECRVDPKLEHLPEEQRRRLSGGAREAGWRLYPKAA